MYKPWSTGLHAIIVKIGISRIVHAVSTRLSLCEAVRPRSLLCAHFSRFCKRCCRQSAADHENSLLAASDTLLLSFTCLTWWYHSVSYDSFVSCGFVQCLWWKYRVVNHICAWFAFDWLSHAVCFSCFISHFYSLFSLCSLHPWHCFRCHPSLSLLPSSFHGHHGKFVVVIVVAWCLMGDALGDERVRAHTWYRAAPL